MRLADEFERRLEAVLEEGVHESEYRPHLRALGKWLTHNNELIFTALREYEERRMTTNT